MSFRHVFLALSFIFLTVHTSNSMFFVRWAKKLLQTKRANAASTETTEIPSRPKKRVRHQEPATPVETTQTIGSAAPPAFSEPRPILSLRQQNGWQCWQYAAFNGISFYNYSHATETEEAIPVLELQNRTLFDSWIQNIKRQLPITNPDNSWLYIEGWGSTSCVEKLCAQTLQGNQIFETLSDISVVELDSRKGDDFLLRTTFLRSDYEYIRNNIERFRTHHIPQVIIVNDDNSHWFACLLTPDNHIATADSLGGKNKSIVNNIRNLFVQQKLPDTQIVTAVKDLLNLAKKEYRKNKVHPIQRFRILYEQAKTQASRAPNFLPEYFNLLCERFKLPTIEIIEV